MLKKNWMTFKDTKILTEYLVEDILSIANESINKNSKFSIVLAGGNSFLDSYKILRESNSDWKKWHIYIGDERCLPINDKERNDKIIHDVWLNNDKIPKKNINFIKAELGIKNAVQQYETVLNNITSFDLVLLGMGDDGHTASLFPNHSYDQDKSVVAEYNAPKYPKERISLSYSRLNNSQNVFKLVCGRSKSKALGLWINNVELPINQIYGNFEKVYICDDALMSIS